MFLYHAEFQNSPVYISEVRPPVPRKHVETLLTPFLAKRTKRRFPLRNAISNLMIPPSKNRMLKASYFSAGRFDGDDFRTRPEHEFPADAGSPITDHTTVFSEDISRIIYCSAFRRMQGKTQVHPLPTTDYVRNRLTHTFEVANVGRLIATQVARTLASRQLLPEGVSTQDVIDIVVAACLAHDIGNPPFGHTGEEAIKSWFSNNSDLEIVTELTSDEKRKNDFLMFDGNGYGFRVLNNTQGWRREGGLRLSAAVLGAFTKYPFSAQAAAILKGRNDLSKDKFGYMEPEKQCAEKVFQELGLTKHDLPGDQCSFSRHPLSYIMEAADDVAYLTTDIQDGHKHGSFSYTEAEKLLKDCSAEFHMSNWSQILGKTEDDRIQYLRLACASTLADDAYQAFVKSTHYDKIASGTLPVGTDLLSLTTTRRAEIEAIRETCSARLYYTREKMEIEAGGHYVVDGILDNLMAMVDDIRKQMHPIRQFDITKSSRRFQNLFHLLPHEVQQQFPNAESHEMCYHILDFVVGMTDNYAIDFFQKITGSKLRV